ncbi:MULTISPECIES: [FeFe] hydrogenase H-cluster maturation GTPase HydF [Blautia]|uniref:[FeFe] hydrogenase H-cluster maturation GTPase HydF n=1 Tax=Blautia TaxID=572511 RepID=UPI001D07B308|nr:MULTISPECIES: [FeFe] hydrogenase H-cluster maturation GTPase HydF [Blautia]MCB6728520.1 [FeFe] hydrogenase H-cluster maturation GTPase HydF [Blautia obeum]MCB6739702.1 [FeFe] hydrogenase H-cluster maturation GTPase HydF [Blautia sp. 210820-DFI.6.14]MCB6955860.1 [FeFe] hydrogenase H-cluster maturation GTPase HydF [Blautia obeum]MCG4672959.1 [FeFe] hydrogenase H-cluster maturation GTPase HydF [Blautia obeum]MDE8678728.1 [FeFe] hydrogenase H-cluster maturation GTPase HydF [Blautia schinkii]
MGMNQTPASERVHISFFGKRNAGKSSVINAVTGQDLAIVSSVMGTTTDPVYKTMELLPLGPVMVIDTPGIDDKGELGALRVRKSYQVLNKTDIAILVIDSTAGKGEEELELIHRFHKKGIPYLIVYNKIDLLSTEKIKDLAMSVRAGEVLVSASDGMNIQELKEKIASLKPEDTHKYPLIQDLIEPLDLVILVVPIDKAAPKGRLILPQQQTIRDILERGALSLVVRDTELKSTLDHFLAQGVCPKLVVTDSQAFARVSKAVPENITLTSFSILFSRYKGELEIQLKGIAALSSIEDGDRILIAEGCTHHRQCGDIGTCKMPEWIRNYTGKKPVFEFTSGTEFPDDVSSYKMVVHCGGCMLNEREMKYRIACCQDQGVPITNYGILIAQVTGILKRSLGPFPEMQKLI